MGFCFDNTRFKTYTYDMNFLNIKNISILGSLILAVGVGVYFVQQSNESKEQSAKAVLYEVQKTLDSETAKLTEAEKAPGAKYDVALKLPKTVAELNRVLADGSLSKQVHFEAAIQLGNLYADHQVDANKETTLHAFNKAVEFAKTDFQKSTSRYLLGVTHEQQGQLKDAEEAFKKALSVGYEGMTGELMLSLVRISIKNSNPAQAKTYADQLNKDHPGTRAAQEAQKLINKS